MIEIYENYYLISKEEITTDMEPIADGLYKIGEKLYEVTDKKNDSPDSPQESSNKQTGVITSTGYLTIFFICSVLLLSFAVLCIYVGANHIVNYESVMNQGNQLGALDEILVDESSDLLRNGVLWILGGAASLILGSLAALFYHSQK